MWVWLTQIGTAAELKILAYTGSKPVTHTKKSIVLCQI